MTTKDNKCQDEYEHLKDGTRWENFSHWELQMLRYGLSQIYDNTNKDTVNKLLIELNNILSPRTLQKEMMVIESFI